MNMRGAALLLVPLGLAVGAAAPPDSVPDTCARLPAPTVRALLFDAAGGTLDNWSSMRGGDELGCTWEARPQGRTTVRRLVLTIRSYRDAAKARAAIAPGRQGAAAADAQAAGGGRDDDLVHLDSSVSAARHGAVVATLDASGAELAGPDGQGILDTGALTAAGATIHAKPVPADVAPQGPSTGNAASWTPPAHDAGWWGRVLAPGVALLAWLASWRFFALIGLLVGGVVIASRKRDGRHGSGRVAAAGGLFLFGIYNMTFGTTVADILVYDFGTAGAATITDTFGTSTQYNNHDVMGYHVLVRTPEGTVRQASFRDDDFNVYPPHNATTYPAAGDAFTVRYLPGFSSRFVIVSDDGSPWAQGLRCAGLSATLAAARRNIDFAPGDVRSQRAARAAQAAVRANGC